MPPIRASSVRPAAASADRPAASGSGGPCLNAEGPRLGLGSSFHSCPARCSFAPGAVTVRAGSPGSRTGTGPSVASSNWSWPARTRRRTPW